MVAKCWVAVDFESQYKFYGVKQGPMGLFMRKKTIVKTRIFQIAQSLSTGNKQFAHQQGLSIADQKYIKMHSF